LNSSGVGLFEFVDERFIGDLGERCGHVVLEETNVTVDLLDGNLSEDLHRRREVLPAFIEKRRHPLLAGDERPQPVGSRRVFTFHDDVRRPRNAAAV
jgi:hypothetical protein